MILLASALAVVAYEPVFKVKNVVSCSDTEEGADINEKGTVSAVIKNKQGTKKVTRIDKCTGEQLLEYFCLDNDVYQEIYTCPEGQSCFRGKCAELNCERGWVCDGTARKYQLEDCSYTRQVDCKYGCEEGVCRKNPTMLKINKNQFLIQVLANGNIQVDLNGNWNIDEDTSQIISKDGGSMGFDNAVADFVLLPSGSYNYMIKFTNKAGIEYHQDIFARNSTNEFHLGRFDGTSIFNIVTSEIESITKNEYFVVSKEQYSHILQFKNVKPGTYDDDDEIGIFLIKDVGNDEIYEIIYTNLQGILELDGNQYKINLTADTTSAVINGIDLNGDGWIGGVPFIVNIISPADGSTINSNSVWLNVTTSKEAVCTFHGDGCPIGEPSPPAECDELVTKTMHAEDEYNHFYQVDNLKNNFIYEVIVDCEDNSGDLGENSITFYANNEEECIIPPNGMVIIQNTTFCPGNYNFPDGIAIGADNIVLDCNDAGIDGSIAEGETLPEPVEEGVGAELEEKEDTNSGIYLYQNENVIIKNCNIINYEYGFEIHESTDLILQYNTITNNIYGIWSGEGSFDYHINNNVFTNNHIELTYSGEVDQTLDAEHNYWGTTNITEIQDKIHDYYDDDSKGIVDFFPFLDSSGDIIVYNEVMGNKSDINSTIDLNITIDNSTNISQGFTGVHEVEIKDEESNPIVSFYFNFSNSSLNLSNILIERQESGAGSLVVSGINLPSGMTKTMYINNTNNITTLCIKDEEVTSISAISSLCKDSNEYVIKCPGINGKYQCNFTDGTNSTFVITGLEHSAIQQQTYCGDGIQQSGESCSNCPEDYGDCPQENNGGSSSGGGGGGSGLLPVVVEEPEEKVKPVTKESPNEGAPETEEETAEVEEQEVPQQKKGFFARIINFIKGLGMETPTGGAVTDTETIQGLNKQNKIIGLSIMFTIIILGVTTRWCFKK